MGIGGLLSFLTWAVTATTWSAPVTNWPWFIVWVGVLILVANIVVYNLYGWLLRSYSITLLSLSGFLSPGFGAIYEWLFMNGQITWHYWSSLLLVTVGLYVFYSSELMKKEKAQD